MKHLLLFSTLLLYLTACQQVQTPVGVNFPATNALYLDQYFISTQMFVIESEADIFALDDEMKAMVKQKLLSVKDSREKTIRLLEHIFNIENIGLNYNSGANITAREAYHQHTANCMSLTIMAYALAKEANLDIYFQEVLIPEYWVRNGKYNMLTGHINLLVKQNSVPGKSVVYGRTDLEVDFDPFTTKSTFPRNIISKSRVIAMYYNNKGAQALVNADYQKAYRYLTASTKKDNSFSIAWGNLGVLYKIINEDEFAKKAYQHALILNQNNATVMGNLAILLTAQGELDAAQVLEETLQKRRYKNPYYHALLADEAFYKENYTQALSHYKKAIKMNSNVHEFHFGIAKTYYKLDRLFAAQKHMRKALKLNKTRMIESQYLAKLNFLKQLGKMH